MCAMQGTWRIFTRVSGNLLDDSAKCYHFKIPRNVQQESGKCLRRFDRMFKKILGNVEEDSGECWRRLRRTCEKIPGNVQADFGKCY